MDIFYNNSTSDLNIPDIKQQTYHKNIFTPNGVWDPIEEFVDNNQNGVYDDMEIFIDEGNGYWNEGESFIDMGNGYWNEGESYTDAGLWDEINQQYIGDNNGEWDFVDLDGDGICNNYLDHNGDGFPGSFADQECEIWNDLGDGIYNESEEFVDLGLSLIHI